MFDLFFNFFSVKIKKSLVFCQLGYCLNCSKRKDDERLFIRVIRLSPNEDKNGVHFPQLFFRWKFWGPEKHHFLQSFVWTCCSTLSLIIMLFKRKSPVSTVGLSIATHFSLLEIPLTSRYNLCDPISTIVLCFEHIFFFALIWIYYSPAILLFCMVYERKY